MGQHQQGWRHNQCQQGRKTQARDNGRGQLHPERRYGATHFKLATNQVDRHAAGHGQQAKAGGKGGEKYRSQTQTAGLDNHPFDIPLWVVFPQVIIGVDQNNVVVHNNPGQRHNADPRHNGTERLPQNNQPQQHPHGRHDHRRQDEACLVKTVELGHQQNTHQRQGQSKGLADKRDGLVLFFIGTAKHHLQ